MNKVIFIEDKAGMAYLRSWSGPIGRDMSRRIRTVEYFARATAPARTGLMRASISSDRGYTRGGNLIARVGVNPGRDRVGYAYFQHEGTQPHIIVPRRAKLLRFRVGGKVVFAKRVRHPGTRPNPYLTRFLRRLVK